MTTHVSLGRKPDPVQARRTSSSFERKPDPVQTRRTSSSFERKPDPVQARRTSSSFERKPDPLTVSGPVGLQSELRTAYPSVCRLSLSLVGAHLQSLARRSFPGAG
jgi:hypothetical protein